MAVLAFGSSTHHLVAAQGSRKQEARRAVFAGDMTMHALARTRHLIKVAG